MAENDDEDDSRKEEIANAATHGFGVLLCLIGIPLLIFRATHYGADSLVWAVSIYGLGLVMVYLSSTLYHISIFSSGGEMKRRLRIWDHISIFFLIAGTHTPIVLKYIDFSTATIFLSIMWGIVALGSLMKIFYTGKMKIFSIGLYLALGWMAVFIIRPIITNMPTEVFWWVLGGGLAYTSGVAFYVWRKLKYHHAVWHCFVMAGTAAHFYAIYLSLTAVVRL